MKKQCARHRSYRSEHCRFLEELFRIGEGKRRAVCNFGEERSTLIVI